MPMRIRNVLIQTLFSLITIMVFTILPSTSVAIAGDVGIVIDLVLLPATQTVEVDDVFSINIEAQCNGQDVTGISAFLDFDPTYLQVQSVTPGVTLDLVIQNTYDNTAGTIDYSAGTLTTPYPSDTFTIATVTFKKIDEVNSTLINFSTNFPRESNVDYGGTSKLRNLTGATVVTPNTSKGPIETVDGEDEVDSETEERDNLPSPALKPAVFSMENLVISPTEVVAGESVTISMKVINTGGMQGSYTLNLKINGAIEAVKVVTLVAGESKTVSFTVSKDTEGDYSVEIDSQTGEFTVLPTSSKPTGEFTVSPTSSRTNWPLIGGIIAAVIVVGIIIMFLIIIWRRVRG